MSHTLILCALAIASFVTYSEAIKCWTCSSDLDQNCSDPFSNSTPTLTDCNTQSGPSYPFLRGKSVCKKIKQVVNGEVVVIRSCAWLANDGEDVGECPKTTTPSYIKIEFCETCKGDACNSAPSSSAATFIAFLIPAFTYFLAK